MAKRRPLSEEECRELKSCIRAHIQALLRAGVTRKELAEELHVTKQAISSYVNNRTTPKPHIVARLLGRWPATFHYKGEEFGPGAFGAGTARPHLPEPTQVDLFESLSALRKQPLRVEVVRTGPSEGELRLIVKITR